MDQILAFCLPVAFDLSPTTLSYALPSVIIPPLLNIVLGALARRPGTRLLRLAIFPLAAISWSRLACGFAWPFFPAAIKFVLSKIRVYSLIQLSTITQFVTVR